MPTLDEQLLNIEIVATTYDSCYCSEDKQLRADFPRLLAKIRQMQEALRYYHEEDRCKAGHCMEDKAHAALEPMPMQGGEPGREREAGR